MIKFIKEEKRLTSRESQYWEKVFNSNLMIGTEIEIMFNNQSVGTREVSGALNHLNPGGSPGAFRSYVETIKSDGSLRNGAEILTPGRRIYGFMEQFAMYQSIYSPLRESEPIICGRMGWHNHIVLQNYDSVRANEMPIPRIILDNLMQLLKIYYPALAFMSSTMPEDGYTRYSEYCRDSTIKDYNIDDNLSRINTSSRYMAVNMCPLRFNTSENTIDKFHLEFRFADGTLFPIQMASLNVLYKALVIKAIRLSKFGIVECGRVNNELFKFKNSGEDSTRLSYTIAEERMKELSLLSEELVDLLSPEIVSIDILALSFLKELAKEPISMLFRKLNTKDVREINDYLEEKLDVKYSQEDKSILPLVEIIEIGSIRNVESVNEWIEKASSMASFKEPIEDMLTKIRKERKLMFVKELGFYFE